MFDIQVSPYDPSLWLFTWNGMLHKVRVPKFAETDTTLNINHSNATLNYHAEAHEDVLTGAQLGGIIKLDDLRNVSVDDATSCNMLVFNPYCSACGDGCRPVDAVWEAYSIPDAGDCTIEPDEDGYYHVLVKNDCGCIKECRLPVVAPEAAVISYLRDSVPDDPDFPWYYGLYNDKINLHLEDNAPKYFGAYALEVTVHYGIQVVHPSRTVNMNFRSIVVPVIEEGSEEDNVNIRKLGSVLQDDSTTLHGTYSIPWGTKSMRGSLTFIVPKGKEAYLHHEFRLISQEGLNANPRRYAASPYDGQKVSDDIAGQLDAMVWTASRLNQLEVVVKPVRGAVKLEPVADAYRDQLDDPVDEYPGYLEWIPAN